MVAMDNTDDMVRSISNEEGVMKEWKAWTRWTGWKTWSEWTAGLDGKANFFVLYLRLSRSVSFVVDLNIVV